mgnify:CR=1 FL=1
MDPERIEELKDPAIYPERSDSVIILQTHLSVVVLSGDSAYKFKKAIILPFADFSSLEKRRFFCEEELRLNRRLCPEIYESVVELRRGESGKLQLGDSGELLDYAVKMRRMPEERMMDVLLAENVVGADEIQVIARRVVAFHGVAERGPRVTASGDPEKLRDFALANFSETRGLFPAELHEALAERTRRDLDRILPLLKSRAEAGLVVDGHGDLHARNICLIKPPAIFDCIEFNPAFRCVDVATEHAFLLMDLRHRGHPELARIYLDTVLAESRDEGMKLVLPTLVRYRAMVRAKVSAITAGEKEFTPEARAEAGEAAREYLRLAAVSAIEEDGPWWLIFCGLPASGKSSIAHSLVQASREAWSVFSTDHIRKELAGVPPTEILPPQYYSDEFSRRTYGEVRVRAAADTKANSVVILDANFRGRGERALALAAARAAGARLVILHIETDERTVIERLNQRKSDPRSESDADREVYEKLKSQFEAPQAYEADLLLSVSGDPSPDIAADEIICSLLGA